MDESQRIAQAQAGDRLAFDELVRQHFARVYATLFRIAGNHEDAEDLAQETFVRAHHALRFYRAEGSFEGWLLRIAVHLARDQARSRKRRGQVELSSLELCASDEPAWQALGRRELSRELSRSIAELPESLRVALVLRVLEGLDYSEVARLTGFRAGTVRTQVMKARRILARLLAPFFERNRP